MTIDAIPHPSPISNDDALTTPTSPTKMVNFQKASPPTVSTMADLLRSPPSKLTVDDLTSRFPSMRNSPALLQLLERNASHATFNPKRESVRNLPANIVSERHAYFEIEIATELAKLESSKEWPDIKNFVKAYLGINLVISEDPPTPIPGIMPTPPTSRPHTPSPSLLSAYSSLFGTDNETPLESFGVHSSVIKCLLLLPQINYKWGNPHSQSVMALSASISQFMAQWKVVLQLVNKSRTLKEMDLDDVDLTLVSAVLDEVKSGENSIDHQSLHTFLSWKPQLVHLFSKAHAFLQQVELQQKREFAALHVDKLRRKLFSVVSKFLYSQNFTNLNHEHSLTLDIMSGTALVDLVLAIITAVNDRARKLDLPPAISDSHPQIPVAYYGKNLLAVTKNWLALSRAADQLLGINFGAWDVRPLSIAKAVTPLLAAPPRSENDSATDPIEIPQSISAAIELTTILLGMRYAQVATSSPLMLKLEDLNLLRECIQLAGGAVGSPMGTPFSSIPGVISNAERVSTTFNGYVFLGPLGYYQQLDLDNDPTSVVAGDKAAPIMRVPEFKSSRHEWQFQRYMRVMDALHTLDETSKIPYLVQATHVEIPELCQPKIPVMDVPREWMPYRSSVILHIDPKSLSPDSSCPLMTYLLRWHTFKLETEQEAAPPNRVDRHRAYNTNRILLQIFRRVTQALVVMHEDRNLAHGALCADNIFILETPMEANDVDVCLLAPSLCLPPPIDYEPGLSTKYDSTLADDVRSLGLLFDVIVDKFWYRRPIVSSVSRLLESPTEMSPRMNVFGAKFPPEPLQPERFHPRSQSALSLTTRPSSKNPLFSLSRSGPRSATLPRSASMTRTKRKKRPITIHLAPSIHPPWSPLYNEAATTVIPHPESNDEDEDDLNQAERDEFAKLVSPLEPVPEIKEMMAQDAVQGNEPLPSNASVSSAEQDSNMEETYLSLKQMINRMLSSDLAMRPFMREVVEQLQ